MEWKGIPAEHPGSHFGASVCVWGGERGGGGAEEINWSESMFFSCLTDVFKDY